MTQEEHLNRIVAKCRELLAGAEKRTPGKWSHWPTHWAGGGSSIKYGSENCPWINSDGKSDIARVNPTRIYTSHEPMANAAFISSCAGPAEAGWRATIAAIDMLQKDYESLNDAGNKDGMRVIQWRMAKIIAAWPESLLS